MNDLETRRKEVMDWLENLIAARENYIEFGNFPGNVKASTFEGCNYTRVIHIFGLRELCDYAGLEYIESSDSYLPYVALDFNGFRFYDDFAKED